MTTLFVTHPAGLNHLTPAGHPERPDRLRAIDKALEAERFYLLAREQAPMAEVDVITLCHPASYVEAIRNTQLLVQLFIVFFGLPSLGLRLDAGQAALIALSVNLGAYATEIIRAGLESVPNSQVDAGLALGLTRAQVLRHVVLYQAVKAVYPALASQLVLLMLATSIASQIGAEELFHAGAYIDSRTFRSFEVYAVTTATYLLLALMLKGLLGAVQAIAFGPMPRRRR